MMCGKSQDNPNQDDDDQTTTTMTSFRMRAPDVALVAPGMLLWRCVCHR